MSRAERHLPPVWAAGGGAQFPRSARRQWLIVTVLVLAQMLVWLDNSILNVAVETLADPEQGLGASPAELEWAINSYTLVFAASMFAGGALGDRFGPRLTLVAGLLTFSGASAVAAFSTSATGLVLARGVMGVGSALLMPATLSIIVRATSPENRTRAIAIWASSSGIGTAIGPVTGGFLLSNFWWGSVFLVNVPIVLLCLVGIALFVPEFPTEQRRALDPLGLLLSFGGLLGLVYGIIRGGAHNEWTSPAVLGSMAGGIAILVLFVLVQRRIAEPSFDLRLFSERRFAGGSLGLMFAFFGLSGQLFYGSFYLQGVRGLTPFQTGLMMVSAAVGIVVGNQVSPALVRRFSTRWVVAVGMGGAIATYGAHVFFGLDTPLYWYGILLVAQGFGMGLVSAPTTTAMMAALPQERSGAGSAVNSAMRQVGSAMGVAVLGSILASSYRGNITPALAGVADGQAHVSAEATRFAARAIGRSDLVDAANQAFLQAMYTTAIWTSALSLMGVVLIVICFRPDRPS